MKLTFKAFTKEEFHCYSTWFQHRSISNALGYIDDEWLEYVLNTEGFSQLAFFENNQFVGVCGIQLANTAFNYYAITDLAVNPRLHNKNYGSRILQSIFTCNLFVQSAIWKLIVSRQNLNAQKFFKKNGWIFEGFDGDFESYYFLNNSISQ